LIYLVSFELLARMAQTSPFIPYELGKYLITAFTIWGILRGNNRGYLGIIMLLLLLPALFFDESKQVTEIDIRFNVLGAINIGLAVWFFYHTKFSLNGLYQILILLCLPIVAALSFAIIKTPDLDSIDFKLGANFSVTGGFGSNQVSTAFGLGMMLLFFLWINQVYLSGKQWIDLLLIVAFTFQGLLSFSRGGMLGGFIGIIIFILFTRKESTNSILNTKLKQIRKYLLPGFMFLFVSVWIANEVTQGKLLLRYKGETAGTLAGVKEKSINSLTTGRFDIFLGDLELFKSYGLLGVGAGASRYLRENLNGIISHVEASRLIAEHGVLGIAFIGIVVLLFFDVYRSAQAPLYKGILFTLLVVGWYTSFHAATRTYVTPLLMGLSTIYIIHGQSTISRK
jgi:hypothetical protein